MKHKFKVGELVEQIQARQSFESRYCIITKVTDINIVHTHLNGYKGESFIEDFRKVPKIKQELLR